MNHFKKILPVFVFLLIFSCSNTGEKNRYQNVGVKEAFDLIQNNATLILDVRTPGEYTAGHIKNSVLIPVQILKNDIEKIIAYKNSPVLVYCRSGNRSVTASNILNQNGFKEIYNLKGGIKDWVRKGYSIQKLP